MWPQSQRINMSSGSALPRFQSQLTRLLAVWPPPGYSSSSQANLFEFLGIIPHFSLEANMGGKMRWWWTLIPHTSCSMICCCCPKYLDHYYMSYMWKHFRDENAPIKCHQFYYLEHLFRISLSFWNKHLFFNPSLHVENVLVDLERDVWGKARKGSALTCPSPLTRREVPTSVALKMGPMSQSWKVTAGEDDVIHLKLHFPFLQKQNICLFNSDYFRRP